MSASARGSVDLLGTDGPEPGRRPQRALTVALCAVAVLAAAVVALLQREPAARAPVEVVGSILFEDIDSRTVALPFADEQHRNGVASGRVSLELPDRQLRGDARLEFGASEEVGDEGTLVIHAWGQLRLRFGTDVCRGWLGWSNYVEPLEGGGALHVHCEQGATITARLAATPQPQAIGVAMDLEDGRYHENG